MDVFCGCGSFRYSALPRLGRLDVTGAHDFRLGDEQVRKARGVDVELRGELLRGRRATLLGEIPGFLPPQPVQGRSISRRIHGVANVESLP